MRKPKLRLPLNLPGALRTGARLILGIIIFLVIFFVGRHLGRILGGSDYFRIKDIIASQANAVDLSYLKGRNIFLVDLRKESRYLSEIYPTYRKIRLIRVLPNRLFADFVKRKPVGVLKLYRYFYVDEDSVLFNVAFDQLQELDLPLILGLESKIFGPKTGTRYNVRELAFALNVIKEVNADKLLRDHKIKKIDVADIANAYFFMNDGDFQIKINQEDFKGKLNILSNLLAQLKNDFGNIKYIDLRFREPVIKLKDAK